MQRHMPEEGQGHIGYDSEWLSGVTPELFSDFDGISESLTFQILTVPPSPKYR